MDGVQLPQGQNHFEEAVYFLPLSSQKFRVLILSTLEGWKAESTLEAPSGFEHRTPELGIQNLNHKSITRLTHTGNLFRKNLQLKYVCYSRLQVIQIIGQRKVLYRRIIPEPSCVKKETADIGILVTFSNCDKNLMQAIRITIRHPLRIRKWNKLSQLR